MSCPAARDNRVYDLSGVCYHLGASIWDIFLEYRTDAIILNRLVTLFCTLCIQSIPFLHGHCIVKLCSKPDVEKPLAGDTISSGHYVAAVRADSGDWWECNDAQCVRVSGDDVCQGLLPTVHHSEKYEGCSQTAYVLVYHARQ